MNPERFHATYLIETPLDPAKVANVMAGAPYCGTSTRVHGEVDGRRERARATVEQLDLLDGADQPALPNASLPIQGNRGPWQRARVRISFPVDNIGANLPTLASTVAGNL